jgi:cytochrome b6-f complex iron-sulfur subunit
MKKNNLPQQPAPGSAPADPGAEVTSRRTFVRVAAGGIGACYAAALGYPVYCYLASPIEKAEGMAVVNEVSLPDARKLAPGSALMFKFGSRPALLIHHTDDQWVAMIAVCEHLGCTVQYQADKDRIYCACHGGVYNAYSGANVSGPPPKPLDQLFVKLSDNAVIVSRQPQNA